VVVAVVVEEGMRMQGKVPAPQSLLLLTQTLLQMLGPPLALRRLRFEF
jgi:hypothetical protein